MFVSLFIELPCPTHCNNREGTSHDRKSLKSTTHLVVLIQRSLRVPHLEGNPKMSHSLYVRDAATRAVEKAIGAKADHARQETIQILDKIIADCDKWLVPDGNDLDAAPVIGMDDVHFNDYTRRVNVPANVPANVSVLEGLNEMYAAEGRLLNNTQRALMEHHLRFDKGPGEPGHFSVSEQAAVMQALTASVRA